MNTLSSSESGSEGSTNVDDILDQEPMFHILGKFLVTDDNKNIATVLQELVVELRKLNTRNKTGAE